MEEVEATLLCTGAGITVHVCYVQLPWEEARPHRDDAGWWIYCRLLWALRRYILFNIYLSFQSLFESKFKALVLYIYVHTWHNKAQSGDLSGYYLFVKLVSILCSFTIHAVFLLHWIVHWYRTFLLLLLKICYCKLVKYFSIIDDLYICISRSVHIHEKMTLVIIINS